MPFRWNPLLALTLLGLLAIGGCSSRRPVVAPLVAQLEGSEGHFRTGQIVDLERGEALSFDELIDRLGSKKLVFIGEVHDNPEHHLIQVQILQALSTRHRVVTTAMESFQVDQQPAIDHYLEGNISEEKFLQEVAWQKTWGFGFHLYRPLILLLRREKARILAINAPREIVRKVARSGLGSLESWERSQLAEHINLDNQDHRAYVLQAYREHNHTKLKSFQSFYEAQCVWEDTMAENIATYLKQHEEPLVVFSGNGHIIHKFGIPDRVVSRKPISMATVVIYPLSGPQKLSKGMADYIWLTGNDSRRHRFTR